MTRKFMIIPIKDKTAASMMMAFKTLRSQYQEHWNEVFKTFTTDWVCRLGPVRRSITDTGLLNAPLYFLWKGRIERYNRLIRRFIPKGQ